MSNKEGAPLSHYAYAVATIAAAVLFRWALTPWMGAAFPLATMFCAVAFTSWFGGWGPALFVTVGGFIACDIIFIPGVGVLGNGISFNEAVSVSVYAGSCLAIIALGEATRRAQRRAEIAAGDLAAANRTLESRVAAQSLIAAMVESSDDAILSKSLDGVITSWNRAAERMFGWSTAEAVGRNVTMIVPPDRLDEERRILDSVRKGDRVDHLEVVRITKGGRRLDVSLTVSPIRNDAGLIVGASTIARDITARKQTEAALLQQADALRQHRDVLGLAMRAGHMGAWSRDLVNDKVWISAELEEILGLKPGDRRDRESMARVVHPEDLARLLEMVQQAIALRRDYGMEFRFQHPTLGWRWMEVRGKAVYGTDGKPASLYGLGMDVTERRRSVEALQDADRRKDEFLATLAHELRNPLAPISSGLHILKVAGDDKAASENARAIMERQVAQMVRLVDDLLDVARINTGKVEIRKRRSDLESIVQSAVETSLPLIDRAGQTLNVRPFAKPIYVDADRTRLAQVFANLLNNASKYSDRGQPIEVAVSSENGFAIVSVRDRGIGIPAEIMPMLFEMFQQADRAVGRSQGGLGIGLFLVKRIVEMHGGVVEANSAGPGAGSEFVVRLPVVDSEDKEIAEPEREPQRVRKRVLVVDDNLDAAESLAAQLQIKGHETRMAFNGHEAVDTAREFRPDVMFLDIGLPTIDGHETARQIRSQDWGKGILLIALTGWGQTEDRKRSYEAGFDHHLVKPADPETIARLISAANAS